MEETKYKVRTMYRIYEVENGLLLRPTEPDYGRRSSRYPDFNTISDAEAAILRSNSMAEYVVLPVVEKVIDFGSD